MTTLYMTKGLPASGKSTWAKSQKAMRVNKDDLRKMLNDGKWSRDNEQNVIAVRDQIVIYALSNHKDLIVDDTNLAPKHETRLAQLARAHGADFVIVDDFMNVPVDECIARDQKRPNYVGEKVIRQMYKQYMADTIEKSIPMDGLPYAIICDLDGTLAMHNGRSPYDFTKVLEDSVNPVVLGILQSTPLKKIFVSGRDDSCYRDSHLWLRKAGITEFELHMRKTGDKRKDSIVKREIYEEMVKPHCNVKFVLDDRNQVVEMWRSLGLICLQVAEGDF